MWLENLEREHAKADRDSLAALDKVEASEARRADVRAALQWVTTYATTGERAPRAFAGAVPSDVRKDPNDPATYSSTELLRALRGALERSTLSARPELLRTLRGALEGLTLGARQE